MSNKTTPDLENQERAAYHMRKLVGEQSLSNGAAGEALIKPTSTLNLGNNDLQQVDLHICNHGTETVHLVRGGQSQTEGEAITQNQTIRIRNVDVTDDLLAIYGAAAWGNVTVQFWQGQG